MSAEPTMLSEAFPGYPENHPQTLADLVNADPDTIDNDLAWFLRRQAVEAVRSSDRHYVRSPADVLELLRNGYALHSLRGGWVSYALTGDRRVVLVPSEGNKYGGMRSLRKQTRLLPKPADLPSFPATAHSGNKKPAWLVIYGGTPAVLDKEHVAAGLARLQRSVPVADICFYDSDPEAGIAPTLWSVRAGTGVSSSGGPGGTEVSFPNPAKLQEVNNGE